MNIVFVSFSNTQMKPKYDICKYIVAVKMTPTSLKYTCEVAADTVAADILKMYRKCFPLAFFLFVILFIFHIYL